MVYRLGLVLLVFLIPCKVYAQSIIQLGMPIKCKYGAECFIQQYMDSDPRKKNYKDYTCGPLSYDGHSGTDFRLRDFTKLENNVPVIAAEEGRVKAIRDGMEDISVKKIDRKALKGKACGNAVLIVHKDGYETQYCHLKKGSVKVAEGDRVQKGDMIGYVGLSGDTEFPHLHFTLRKKDKDIDPFIGDYGEDQTCGATRYPLWDQQTLNTLTYIPTALLNFWFFTVPPDADEARNGEYEAKTRVSSDTGLIVLAADIFGIRSGDVMQMEVRDPKGNIMIEDKETFSGNKAQYFHYIGKYRKAEPWKSGKHIGFIRLLRQNQTIFEKEISLVID